MVRPTMTHPIHGPNRFKLGLFSINADGGLTLTRVPERWPARWDEIVAVTRMAEAAGLESVLPIARWKGFGGVTNSREWSFETLTFAAALAGATDRIGLFSTVHVPVVHPVFAAKALMTVDQASRGRAGLNIVCGWNPEEFALFGLPMPSDAKTGDRYAQGLEWAEVFTRLSQGGPPFDFDGRFYRLRGVSGQPTSVQRPRPVTLNAAFSPAGRAFAARAADCLFTTFDEIDTGRANIEDMRARAAAEGRTVDVFTTCHVVCRPSQDEAEAYYEHYAVAMEDSECADSYMAAKEKNSASHDPETYRKHRKRFTGGAGTYPLVGTPEHIAGEIVRMSEVGYAGTTLSFVNFLDELPFFAARVLPLLRDAGLRQ